MFSVFTIKCVLNFLYIFMFVWDFVELILRGGIAGPKVIYVCFFLWILVCRFFNFMILVPFFFLTAPCGDLSSPTRE